jgi:hypothetical protein
MGKVCRFKTGLSNYIWHQLQKVDCHLIRYIEINPETTEENKIIVGESAASFWSGGFVSITNDFLVTSTIFTVKRAVSS